MSRLLAQRLLLVVCMTVPAPTSVLAQRRPVPGIEDASGTALPPLWQESGLSLHQGRGQAGTTLAPFVTSALPEDAAWEGLLAPANHGTTSTFVEFQGKLVLTSSVAGSVATQGLVTWDGTTFEALPALTGYVSALGVWNDHLISATYAYTPFRTAILQLDGAVWDTLGKPNNYVWKFGEFQNHLIAGGRLTAVNGVPCSQVAAFDGSSWSDAGSGITGEVTGLTVHQGKLVAGGSITPAQGVVSLDALGGAWQPVGTGFGAGVTDVLSDGVDLYASGRISNSALTTYLGSFMYWNGTTWNSTGSPTNWGVTDVYMTRWNNKVVVNVRAPGSTVGFLAQWDGSALTPIPGDSLSSIAFGIGTWGSKLVAESPLQNGSVLIPSIATFDGSQWGTVQQAWAPEMHGIYGGPWDIRPWGGKLIVAGILTMLAEQDHWTRGLGIAAWDGAHWSPLGNGIASQYTALGEYGGDLIAFGYSFSVRGTSIQNVARWDGSTWSAIGSNAPTDAVSSASFLGDLYLGTEAGSSILSYWDGNTWTSVPGFASDYVEALAPSGGRLVVAGLFPTVGGLASPNVAFWDGANWAAAGAGVNNIAYTAAEWLGQPVIGGAFTASGATPLPGVAIWDGAQWQPMGTTAVEVDQLRVQDGELYATGDFRLPDDSVVETIAHWTGTDWHVLGSSSTGYPFATYGGYLYQAGSGVEHGHPAHGLSRVPLSAVLDVPKPGPHPSTLALTASPNPSRGRTAFAFTLPSAGHAKLTVVDVTGRVVATLADGPFDAGAHEARWTAEAPPGVYFARLEAFGGASRVVRLVRFE